MNHLLKILLVCFITMNCVDNKPVIYMIGDSTMADKPHSADVNPERGWGQMLPLFFNDDIIIKNCAVNGRSTKSFINEGRWKKVIDNLKPGDYVFIQFGHNDQKYKDTTRFTDPHTSYKKNLVKFVNETRDKGGTPVLFSSIVRRHFNKQGELIDTHGEYPVVVKEVADELKVPFIDMQHKSEKLVLSFGQEGSKELYLWIKPGEYASLPKGKEDNTHFSEKGATEMARLAVEGLKENELEVVKYLETEK